MKFVFFQIQFFAVFKKKLDNIAQYLYVLRLWIVKYAVEDHRNLVQQVDWDCKEKKNTESMKNVPDFSVALIQAEVDFISEMNIP